MRAAQFLAWTGLAAGFTKNPFLRSQPSVAVLGASSVRHKFGNKAVRAYRECGFTVFLINLHEATIEGLPTYRSL